MRPEFDSEHKGGNPETFSYDGFTFRFHDPADQSKNDPFLLITRTVPSISKKASKHTKKYESLSR